MDVLPDIYHSFRKEIKGIKNLNRTKASIDPVDRNVAEAAWLIETVINNNLGFTNDSISETFLDTVQIIFTND
jgi:hypothetical protein